MSETASQKVIQMQGSQEVSNEKKRCFDALAEKHNLDDAKIKKILGKYSPPRNSDRKK